MVQIMMMFSLALMLTTVWLAPMVTTNSLAAKARTT